MTITWNKSRSNEAPVAVDETSSKTSVYLRKNITEQTETDSEGKETKYFEYDEAILTKDEYKLYQVETETELAIAELAAALLG